MFSPKILENTGKYAVNLINYSWVLYSTLILNYLVQKRSIIKSPEGRLIAILCFFVIVFFISHSMMKFAKCFQLKRISTRQMQFLQFARLQDYARNILHICIAGANCMPQQCQLGKSFHQLRKYALRGVHSVLQELFSPVLQPFLFPARKVLC